MHLRASAVPLGPVRAGTADAGAEAHPTDEWQLPINEAEGVLLEQHGSLADRAHAARLGRDRLGLTMPTVLDDMDNAAAEAYAAWPERIYIVGPDGRIAYQGAPGPRGFNPDEAAAALERLT